MLWKKSQIELNLSARVNLKLCDYRMVCMKVLSEKQKFAVVVALLDKVVGKVKALLTSVVNKCVLLLLKSRES